MTDSQVRAGGSLDRTFLQDFTQHWGQAWNSCDADRLLALMAEDVVYDPPLWPTTMRGHAEVRAVLASWRGVPDLRVEEVVACGVIDSSVVTTIVERLVPDELWALFQHVVAPAQTRPHGGGRRRAGDREVLAAIVFVATSGCTWRQVPPVFGTSWQTVYRRFVQWSRARVWAKLSRVVLDELGARGKWD
jgi:transposase